MAPITDNEPGNRTENLWEKENKSNRWKINENLPSSL